VNNGDRRGDGALGTNLWDGERPDEHRSLKLPPQAAAARCRRSPRQRRGRTRSRARAPSTSPSSASSAPPPSTTATRFCPGRLSTAPPSSRSASPPSSSAPVAASRSPPAAASLSPSREQDRVVTRQSGLRPQFPESGRTGNRGSVPARGHPRRTGEYSRDPGLRSCVSICHTSQRRRHPTNPSIGPIL
jgi:hypothetical protein